MQPEAIGLPAKDDPQAGAAEKINVWLFKMKPTKCFPLSPFIFAQLPPRTSVSSGNNHFRFICFNRLRELLENRHLETAFCLWRERFMSHINQLGRTKLVR